MNWHLAHMVDPIYKLCNSAVKLYFLFFSFWLWWGARYQNSNDGSNYAINNSLVAASTMKWQTFHKWTSVHQYCTNICRLVSPTLCLLLNGRSRIKMDTEISYTRCVCVFIYRMCGTVGSMLIFCGLVSLVRRNTVVHKPGNIKTKKLYVHFSPISRNIKTTDSWNEWHRSCRPSAVFCRLLALMWMLFDKPYPPWQQHTLMTLFSC